MIQEQDSLIGRIARSTTDTDTNYVHPTVVALFVGIVADALTTAYGVVIMGLAMETNPIATAVLHRLWMGTDLMAGPAAAIYGTGYIVVGAAVCVVLHNADLPYGRHFTAAWAAVFLLSPIINLVAIARWIAFMPGAGWVP